ncbi:competence/damage-inducible protein A [Granulosicoccus sp. 3-233]|uniref:competence/damage-inducible protein A n=1 Tax=Granulosicoccus sp. 3-233 TaxID=3417969 RepID=UPI003D3376D6
MISDTPAPADSSAPDATTTPPTAAVLLIGNELLSGRTRDINLPHIAESLVARGIRLREARVIADIPQAIVSAINELRNGHDYVFTTGGIGPTHDDITADCVAEAFGVDLPVNTEARALLQSFCDERQIELNEDRLRMARIPEGASLIDNPVSAAPGFRMENVFVMAGVPRIMQAMLASVLPDLRTGPIVHSVSVGCDLGEGTVASALRALQEAHPAIEIGSYPGKTGQLGRLSLVARGTDETELESVRQALVQMVSALGGRLS